MNVLAFSDVHGSARRTADLVAAAAEADLVIGAGDFCNMRQGLARAMDAFGGITAPLVVVPGNAESADELRAAVSGGVTVLHGAGCEVGGLRLFGLGYGVPVTPFGAWSCDLTEAQAEALLGTCAQADVMIFHSPPKGVADVTGRGDSVGSVAIRAAIARVQPQIALCGHVHDSWGQRGRIGASEVVNLGPGVNWFEIGER